MKKLNKILPISILLIIFACSNNKKNDEGTLTLDDMTTEMISNELGLPFNITQDSILEIFERNIHG